MYKRQYIDDPFYPAPTDQFEKCLLIAFSNSGETKEVIDQLRLYRGVQSKIISIKMCIRDRSLHKCL